VGVGEGSDRYVSGKRKERGGVGKFLTWEGGED